jgi:phosphate transport system substrate-binding protein
MRITTIVAAAALVLTANVAVARESIAVAGSSTVLPYAIIVAEAFGENFEFPTPVVEGGGSGSGRKRLCEGTGENTIDIANSSSKMKADEWERCEAVVGPVTEIRIGYDGIVFAANLSNQGFADLTPQHIYIALSKHSKIKTWKEIDTALPNKAIQVFVPGTKHGTREVFDVKVMLEGCKAVGSYDRFLERNDNNKKLAESACMEIRTDGVSVDIDGDYTETLNRLASNPDAIGVFGLSFLLNNQDKLYAADINGVTPSTETIASGEYPISRPLYFYVKNAHLDDIPGMREYIEFFLSDDMAGPDGPLATYGLVSDPELAATQAIVADLK